MAVSKQTTTAATAIGIDLSSLGTSSTFVAGRESNEVDNTTNNYINALVNVNGILGHASTAPTVGQAINVYVWGADTSLATTPIDVLDGVDSAETLGHVSVRDSLQFAGQAQVTVATAGLKYYIPPFAVASFFDGVMPDFWGIFVAHDHTGALAASQTGLFTYQGITYTTA